jgi:hypothetical protein
MRQAATEVDMEITNIQPPKLTADSKLLTGGPGAEQSMPEAVPVTIDIESDQK